MQLLVTCLLILCLPAILVRAQTLLSWSELGTYTSTQVSSYIFTTAENGVTNYKLTYVTKDAHGNTTVASGAVIVPAMSSCGFYPLVSYQHGTVLRKDNVPSRNANNNAEGMGYAAFGFIVTMPDFLGLGDSPGLHPYHHSETQATASLDLMRAARIFIEDTLHIHLNGEVFLAGYSQGGHATMALHKYIEDNNLEAEFNILASAPLSGAYNLSGVQADEIKDSVYGSPSYLPYIVEAYQEVYGNIYTSTSDVYDSPYDVNIPPYFDGTFSLGSFNSSLPTNVYDFMQDTVLDNFIADTINFSHPLRAALKANDNHDWSPVAPVRMCYCTADEQVSYRNALVALDKMTMAGAPDVQAINIGAPFNHSACFLPAMTYAKNWFVSLATKCVNVTSIEQNSASQPGWQYNERSGILSIAFPADVGIESLQIRIFNLSGQLVHSQQVNHSSSDLLLKDLSTGLYLAEISGKESMITGKFFVR